MFQVSTAINLAIHSMAYLARARQNGAISAATIASELRVSPSHLSKVLGSLAGGGLVRSTRGARGGFVLDRDPKDVSLLDIVHAMREPTPHDMCLLGERICPPGQCRLKELRDRVSATIEHELEGITLARFASSGPISEPASAPASRSSARGTTRRASGGVS